MTARSDPRRKINICSVRLGFMFGSNYPMLAPEQALAVLPALELEEEVEDLFMGANAQRVFRL